MNLSCEFMQENGDQSNNLMEQMQKLKLPHKTIVLNDNESVALLVIISHVSPKHCGKILYNYNNSSHLLV